MGITIATAECKDEIILQLNKKLDLKYSIAEDEKKDFTFFHIDLDQTGVRSNLEYLASIIADVVINKLEKKFINKILKHKYQEFNLAERDQIQELTIDHLNVYKKPDPKLGRIVRKQEIIQHIFDYLKQNNDMNIEGFVRFRLKDYLDELNLAIERAVNDYLIQKEYHEFIDLLKYFVDLQEPRAPLVHVLRAEDGSFQLADINEKIISSDYLEGYLAEILDEEVEDEDLLISALINVAPARIVLHFQEEEIEKTVKGIFGDRVDACQGCHLCQKNLTKQE